MWIEVFKVGEQTDSSGKTTNYTSETLDIIANKYNEKIANSKSFEVPLVIGHPKVDDPAFAWIGKLERKGESLFAELKDFSIETKQMIKNGLFRKVSIALYPDLMLRHIGLLGATAPAVKGLQNLNFDGKMEYAEFAESNLDYSLSEDINENFKEVRSKLLSKIEEMEKVIANMELENAIKKVIEDNKHTSLSDLDFLDDDLKGKYLEEFSENIIKPLIEISITADKYIKDNQGYFAEEVNQNYTHKAKDLISKIIEFKGTIYNSNIAKSQNVNLLNYSIANELQTQNINSNSSNYNDYLYLNLLNDNANINPDKLELHKKIINIAKSNNISYEEAISLL